MLLFYSYAAQEERWVQFVEEEINISKPAEAESTPPESPEIQQQRVAKIIAIESEVEVDQYYNDIMFEDVDFTGMFFCLMHYYNVFTMLWKTVNLLLITFQC